MAYEIIKKFVDLQNETEKFLNENKIKEAKENYIRITDAYHEIKDSKLENFHKELAYDNMTKIYNKINKTKKKTKIPYHLIIAGILFLIFGTIIIINPSIVGFVGLDNVARMPLDITFTESGLEQITQSDDSGSINKFIHQQSL